MKFDLKFLNFKLCMARVLIRLDTQNRGCIKLNHGYANYTALTSKVTINNGILV